MRAASPATWEQDFDAFYVATRGDLVHQTFALTGDRAAAERAVHDAYVAAWHHWRKVATYEDPADWVRPHAWALAQRKHSGRLWHRTRGLDPGHKSVLDGLHALPGVQRKVLLLLQVAGVSLTQAARELSLTPEAAERHLQSATAGLAVALDVESASLRPLLVDLGAATTTVRLPRPATVRRLGRRRRRSHTLVAAALTAALAVGSGAFAHEPTSEEIVADAQPGAPSSPTPESGATGSAAASPTPEPSPAMPAPVDLLADEDLRLGGQAWTDVRTHDNTAGDGLTTACQQARFADPDGLSAMVREFKAARKPRRRASQTVEISDSVGAARSSFETTLGWYASCPDGNVHLTGSHRVERVGDEAQILVLEDRRRPVEHAVAVGRAGQLVTTVFVTTRGAAAPKRVQLARTLARATRQLCEVTGDDCVGRKPALTPAPPPPTTGEPGLLSEIDLPRVGLRKPWVGTEPSRAGRNPAATTCDQADFLGSGATRARTRTFLIPDAQLPTRFGLAQTTAVFEGPGAARVFLDAVRDRVAGCEDRDLASNVVSAETLGDTGSRFDGSLYRVVTEISENNAVEYTVGFVRRGRAVSQLTFYPGARGEMDSRTFAALVDRAGVRLAELEDVSG